MDWKTFIADLIGSVAWPAALVVIVFLFRQEGRDLISRTASVKHGDTEVKFRAILSDLVDGGTFSEAEDSRKSDDQQLRTLLRLAELSPKHAVLDAWNQVESAAAGALARAG